MVDKRSDHLRKDKKIRHVDISCGNISIIIIEKNILHSNMQKRKETEWCVKRDNTDLCSEFSIKLSASI